jgi:hypothetical protein
VKPHTGDIPAVRFAVQQFVEDMITRLRPDAHEALELLDAITASLKERYQENDLADALHEAWRLRGALEDLESDFPPSDEALETYRALQEQEH